MGVTQIGNGDFPLNNCAILRQILPESSLDFFKTVLRGEAFANPIANLAGNVRNNIGSALAKIGTLENSDSTGFFTSFGDTLSGFREELVQFESRTNRMSGLITGFQEGEPDMGRILGIGSAYNSALATLASNPEDLLKDNFSHGFNSLKQEFGINAIQQSDSAIEAAGNFLAQFGLGFTEPSVDPDTGEEIPGVSFVQPSPSAFYNEAQQILGDIRSIQQSITNIVNAEDAFLAGALAFLDQFALANTALSSVLTDPCMAGKVIKDLVASPQLTNLIPSLELPSLPTIDEVLSQIPDPEDVANAIKDSVEGIAESVREQVEQVIEQTVEIGRETVEAIEKSAEEIIEAGEQIVEQAEQAARDLATNVEEFGNDVDKFFEDLENRIEEATSDDEEVVKEEESTDDIRDETVDQPPVSANLPIKATQEPRTLEDVSVDTALSYRSVARSLLDVYKNQQRNGGFTSTGLYDAPVEFLLATFPLDQLEKSLAYIDAFPDDRNDFVIGTFGLPSRLEEAIEIKKNSDLPEGANPGI